MPEVEEQIKVDSPAHSRNAARIQRDEQELKELMEQAGIASQDNETQEEAPIVNPIARELRTPQFRMRVYANKKRKSQLKPKHKKRMTQS